MAVGPVRAATAAVYCGPRPTAVARKAGQVHQGRDSRRADEPMGGRMRGGRALGVGCGRGVAAELILDMFGADSVDAFDLDPRMVALAGKRLATRGDRVRLWVGDATSIPAPDSTYEAVFDFGILHHIPRWRSALAEVRRVLKPDGVLYAEEALRRLIAHPIARRLLVHPRDDRFDSSEFTRELRSSGLEPYAIEELWGWFAWFAARKSPAA